MQEWDKMKTLREVIGYILTEATIHTGISINHLKAVAKNSPNHVARFVIDRDNKLNAGDAYQCIHRDLNFTHDHHTEIAGFAKHNPEDDSYEYDSLGHDDHPLLHKMTKIYKMKKNNNGAHEWRKGIVY